MQRFGVILFFFFSSRRRHTRLQGDWSSDVCSSDLVSPDGKPLLLKGINLGNWLLPEGYMFKFKTTNSPRLIQTAISELVGEDEARRFWKTYRDNYITRADIHFIKQSGFNRSEERRV